MTSSANTPRRTPHRRTPRSKPRMPHSLLGRGRRLKSGMIFCCAPRLRSWPGARSSGAFFRARKARPLRKALARRREQDRSSTSSLAKCYGFRERSSPACGRVSTSKSRATLLGSSALSRLGTFRSRSLRGRSRRRLPMAIRLYSSPRISFPVAPTRCQRSSSGPAFPRAFSISSSGAARWSAKPSSSTRKSTRSRSRLGCDWRQGRGRLRESDAPVSTRDGRQESARRACRR